MEPEADAAAEALPVLQAALRAGGAWHAHTHLALGSARAALGDSAGSLRAYTMSLALEPACAAAGDALWRALNGNEVAQAAALGALAADGRATWAAFRLADTHEVAGRCDQAIPLLQAALRVDPQDAGAWARLGRCYLAAGKATHARRALARAVDLAPADPTPGASLCALLDSAGEAAAADAAALAAFQRAPDAAWAAARVAASCTRAGRHVEALPALQACLRAQPRDSATWEALGACYTALGRPSAAAKAFARALALVASPNERPFSAIASASLALSLGGAAAAEACAAEACAASGGHPAAQLAASGAALATAREAFRWGAHARAAAALGCAVAAATAATASRATACCTWKALGDALTAHRDVTPQHVAGAGDALAAGVSAYVARGEACMRGGAAYARAVHLAPWSGCGWGDLAAARGGAAHAVSCGAAQQRARGAALRASAARAACTGLRLAPACAGLWCTLAAATSSPAAAESALCHALALDAQAPGAAAALGRLYLAACVGAAAGGAAAEGALVRAASLLESARAGDASDAGAWVSTALVFAAQRNEEQELGALRRAVAVGGDPEADLRLAVALLHAAADEQQDALAPAARAAAALPLQPGAHAALGQLHRGRGLHIEAAAAYERAAALTAQEAAAQQLRVAAADARAAADAQVRVARTLEAARASLGAQLAHAMEAASPAPNAGCMAALRVHGAAAAVLQVLQARTAPAALDAATSLLGAHAASALLQRRTAHMLPTLPMCTLSVADDGGASAWAQLAQQHAAAATAVVQKQAAE
jgi:tetratricopeptide (TPR) repeat protein